MKTLFIGGIKSGKSRLAEAYILAKTDQKPYYLATTEFIDDELRLRIHEHQQRRAEQFVTLEEPLHLLDSLQKCTAPVLIECVSMWLNNMLFHQYDEAIIMQKMRNVLDSSNEIVFVQNEVGLGVISDNPLVRQYVDISGKLAQLLASRCEAVFFCCAGLPLQLK